MYTEGHSEEISKLEELATQWEKTHDDWQLTHIRNHPAVSELAILGKEAIPFMLNRLEGNVLWYIPIEKIVLNEFDEEILPDKDQNAEGKGRYKNEYQRTKYGHLEGHRKSIEKWVLENKDKF